MCVEGKQLLPLCYHLRWEVLRLKLVVVYDPRIKEHEVS